MQPNRLGNWEKSEREALARRLRRTLIAASGYEEFLWKELLRRLEQSLEPLTTREAVRCLNISSAASSDNIVNQAATKLRRKIKEVSKTFIPDPGVYLSHQTYAIQVTSDPPPAWKQNVGPSIGLLLADASDWFVGDLIRGVNEVCNINGFDLLVDVSNDDQITEARKLKRLLERTHGVLIVPVSHATLDPASRKLLKDRECVLVDRYFRDLADVYCVHFDDISAGRQAGLYLKERGCKRVLIVDQASRSPVSFAITPLEDRVKGCEIQLRDHITVRHLRTAGSDEQGGFDALDQFEKKERLAAADGIFALTDRLALGCRHYLATRQPSLELPLIGTEGQQFGDFLEPPLVSIGFDNVEMGRRAAIVLFAKLHEGDMPHTDCSPHFLITPSLLMPSSASPKRDKIPINFSDASVYYSP